MATYEYHCPLCNQKFEKMQVPMRDCALSQHCPNCTTNCPRVLSPVNWKRDYYVPKNHLPKHLGGTDWDYDYKETGNRKEI